MIKKAALIILSLAACILIFCAIYKPPLPDNHGKVDAQLFLSKSEKQPLLVAFGGSGGGMTYAQESAGAFREKILSTGYALLTIGYIGTDNSQSEIDRISLNAIYDTIQNYKNHPLIDGQKVTLLGLSRGGELVLNLASRYSDFDAVISLVPSNMSMPLKFNRFGLFETSAWTIDDKEIPCLSSTYKKRKILQKEGLHKLLSEILKDEQVVNKAEIPVENMNCPVLLISAKDDEVWPSTYMSDRIMQRLKDNDFRYGYRHIVIDGGHGAPFQDYEMIIDFLEGQLTQELPNGI